MAAPTDRMRRQPQQSRSRAMVDRIVEAARDLLVADGLGRLTTNRIAERAGISPGSLYQYFPDKAAIVSAVVDRYSAQIGDEVTAAYLEAMHLPVRELLRTAFTALLEVLTRHREYVRVVRLELPQSQVAGHVHLVERRVEDLVAVYLTATGGTSAQLPAASSAWLLVRLVEHLCVQWVLEQPAIDQETFVAELTLLTQAHLDR